MCLAWLPSFFTRRNLLTWTVFLERSFWEPHKHISGDLFLHGNMESIKFWLRILNSEVSKWSNWSYVQKQGGAGGGLVGNPWWTTFGVMLLLLGLGPWWCSSPWREGSPALCTILPTDEKTGGASTSPGGIQVFLLIHLPFFPRLG